MAHKLKLVKNVVGRQVPTMVNGIKSIPFQGIGNFSPMGVKAAPPIRSCQDFPSSGNKVVASIKEALKKCGIKNGMTISNHHHFRNGDLEILQTETFGSCRRVHRPFYFYSSGFSWPDKLARPN